MIELKKELIDQFTERGKDELEVIFGHLSDEEAYKEYWRSFYAWTEIIDKIGHFRHKRSRVIKNYNRAITDYVIWVRSMNLRYNEEWHRPLINEVKKELEMGEIRK